MSTNTTGGRQNNMDFAADADLVRYLPEPIKSFVLFDCGDPVNVRQIYQAVRNGMSEREILATLRKFSYSEHLSLFPGIATHAESPYGPYRPTTREVLPQRVVKVASVPGLNRRKRRAPRHA